jgi:hypothetical protein
MSYIIWLESYLFRMTIQQGSEKTSLYAQRKVQKRHIRYKNVCKKKTLL